MVVVVVTGSAGGGNRSDGSGGGDVGAGCDCGVNGPWSGLSLTW